MKKPCVWAPFFLPSEQGSQQTAVFPNNLLAITGTKKQTKKKKYAFTCSEPSTGEAEVRGEILVHLLKLSESNGLWGHPSPGCQVNPLHVSAVFF